MTPLFRQVAGFLVSGALSFGVDAGVYAALLSPLGTFWSKQCAFVAATIASFFLNKTLSFGGSTVSRARMAAFVGYYAVMAWVNPGLNEAALALVGDKPLAFVLATVATAVLNFFYMKLIVFKGANT